MNIPYCEGTPNFLYIFDISYAPPLLFYAYIPIVIVSLIVGLYILFKDKFSLIGKLLLGLAIFFSLWVLNIIGQWLTPASNINHFFWELTAFFEIFIAILVFYFTYVFITKRDLSLVYKIVLSLIVLPVLIGLPTKYNMISFDPVLCEATVGIITYYVYTVEILTVFAIAFLGFKYGLSRKTTNTTLHKQALFVSIGSAIFLLIFSLSNIFGEVTQTYEINLVGPLGMVVFLAFLSYLIVRFKSFDTKLISTQILLIGLGVLVGSLLFIDIIEYVRVVISLTLIILLFLGILLVKNVKHEIKQREEIEKLAVDLHNTNSNLERANDRLKELDKQKTEFVSFATHQLRSPLTAMKGYSSLILEGDYGDLQPDLREAVERINESSNTLTTVVNDYLNISRIELGTMKYDLKPFDLRELAGQVIGELQPNFDKAGVKISLEDAVGGGGVTKGGASGAASKSAKGGDKFMVKADLDKFKQVIGNLIDNSVKYTPKGTVTVSVTKNAKKGTVLFAVKDTGIGMAAGVIPKLFAKFSRAENANKVNIRGTGLGLYVAKEIVKAHNGKVWAESEGEGKGSQFYVELPAA